MRALAPVLGFALLSVSATLGVADKTSPAAPLVWPPAPNDPRVIFVRAFEKPADLGIKGSAFRRAANWITGGDNGARSLANPVAVAVDDSGGLCFADTGARKVSYYDPAGNSWRQWDHADSVAFNTPVAVTKRGETIFVADAALAEIIAFNTGGKLLLQINHDLKRPCGLALRGERLYVADVEAHCIIAFDLQGKRISSFGQRGAGPGEFNFPTHIAATPDHLLVTDSLNSRVQVFDSEGKYQATIGGPGDTSGHFGRPKGVAVDAFGHVYVTDAVFDNIQVFDLAGQFLLNLGGSGAGPGQFAMPNGIAVSRDNHIYVADSCNHRVQVFQYIGQP